MISDLHAATEHLYEVFLIYPLRNTIDISPIRAEVVDQSLIRKKPLRDLEAEDLSSYSMSAMTTWGSVEDFKHFLPRLLELSTSNFTPVDAEDVFGKLDYAQWEQWDAAEQEAIKSFVSAWWEVSTISRKLFQGENFIFFIEFSENVHDLLKAWKINIRDESFLNLVHYIFDYFQEYKVGKHIKKQDYDVISKWLAGKLSCLEEGFYFYEKTNPDLAQKISYCYEIVERLK